jgi:diketogulonate reductase-like aldo/keto reductase
MRSPVRRITLPSGENVPALGIGTWTMGDRTDRRREEAAALNLAVDLGMTLIDTAEMYGSGAAESLIADALDGRRDELFLVSKVLPQHASRAGTIAACEASLKRLKTDRIDLYLLHWRGSEPLERTLNGFHALLDAGKIRYWGVSNFDTDDMEELLSTPGADAGGGVQTNQVLYNLSRRGIEFDLLPWCAARSIPVMAYSPIEQGRLLKNARLRDLAAKRGISVPQLALAWVLRDPHVIAIPKSGSVAHVRENHGALAIELTPTELAELDRVFRPPTRKKSLEMI